MFSCSANSYRYCLCSQFIGSLLDSMHPIICNVAAAAAAAAMRLQLRTKQEVIQTQERRNGIRLMEIEVDFLEGLGTNAEFLEFVNVFPDLVVVAFCTWNFFDSPSRS